MQPWSHGTTYGEEEGTNRRGGPMPKNFIDRLFINNSMHQYEKSVRSEK